MIETEWGLIQDALTVDDFELVEASTITHVSWINEEEPEFAWAGRIRIEVYPDSGDSTPDESAGPAFALWIPDDGGMVSRTPMGPGLIEDRFGYVVENLSIALDAGIWWIGLASAGMDGTDGLALWAVSHSAPFDELFFHGESHLRYPSVGLTEFGD